MKKSLLFDLFFLPSLIAGFMICFNYSHPLKAAPTPSQTEDATAHIQVALLLDISGSMSGLINQAKGKLWNIVNELSEAKVGNKPTSLEISLYVYGSPSLGSHTGYTRQVVPLTTNLDLISQELFALTTSGGDEYCGTVIQKSVDQLSWTSDDNDLRMIFIAGNEPFTQGAIPYASSIAQAQRKGILVNTIFCGDMNEGRQSGWWHGAQLGQGEFMNINHNQAVTHINTPFDQQILDCNTRLNQTYIYYGEQGKLSKARQEVQDQNASSFGTGNVVQRGRTKASKSYKNSSWDLVDAAEEDDFELSTVDSTTLPEPLQKMKKKELEAHIAEQAATRVKIQEEIKVLYQKREEYVKAQQKGTAEGQLDQALLQAIRKQGEAKGMNFKKGE